MYEFCLPADKTHSSTPNFSEIIGLTRNFGCPRGFWNFISCERRFYKILILAEQIIRKLQGPGSFDVERIRLNGTLIPSSWYDGLCTLGESLACYCLYHVLFFVCIDDIIHENIQYDSRLLQEGPAVHTAIVTKETREPAGREFVSVRV